MLLYLESDLDSAWHVDCKDAADAVLKYGRLATVSSIIQHATGNQLKARVKAKML